MDSAPSDASTGVGSALGSGKTVMASTSPCMEHGGWKAKHLGVGRQKAGKHHGLHYFRRRVIFYISVISRFSVSPEQFLTLPRLKLGHAKSSNGTWFGSQWTFTA